MLDDKHDFGFVAGRGIVELVIEKPDGASAYVVNEGGGPQPQARLTLILEGYSAPVTAGNFATNVLQRLYVGKTLTVDYTGVLVGKGTVSGGPNPGALFLALSFPAHKLQLSALQNSEQPVFCHF